METRKFSAYCLNLKQSQKLCKYRICTYVTTVERLTFIIVNKKDLKFEYGIRCDVFRETKLFIKNTFLDNKINLIFKNKFLRHAIKMQFTFENTTC